jgi:putative FmdB family regulatory protein
MPIYEYHCTACDHTFEEWQKITDPPVQKCPKCSKKKVEKMISATSFALKGSGWYATDYGGKSGSEKRSKGALKADAARSAEKDKEQKAAKEKRERESVPSVSSKKD